MSKGSCRSDGAVPVDLESQLTEFLATLARAGYARKTRPFFASRLKYSRWVEVTIVPNEQVETLLRTLVDHFAAMGWRRCTRARSKALRPIGFPSIPFFAFTSRVLTNPPRSRRRGGEAA